jgi:hypothetical protein
MGFGVRIGKPPDSGESAAADLKEQWNLRAQNFPCSPVSTAPVLTGLRGREQTDAGFPQR